MTSQPLGRHDWYRREAWNAEIAEQFEVRLRRARADSRAQYIRIQATHLLSSPDVLTREVARHLLRRVITEFPEDYEVRFAWEQLAASLAEEGDAGASEEALRRTVELSRESPHGDSGTSGTAPLQLAELLISRGGDASLEEAEGLLTEFDATAEEMSIMRGIVYRHRLARARVAAALRRPAAARWALEALQIADETGDPILRHPKIGRVLATPAERAELAALAS